MEKRKHQKIGKVCLWLSGLSAGLSVCALFACPARVVSVPVCIVLALLLLWIGLKKLKKK